MPKVTYYSPSQRKSVNLNGDGLYIQTAEDLRGHEYSFKLGYRGITNISNDARKVKVELLADSDAKLDELRHMMDADLMARMPGTLNVDEYSTAVYCVETKAKTILPKLKELALTLVMLNPYWERPHEKSIYPVSRRDYGVSYPYDFPFDYVSTGHIETISVSSTIPVDFKMRMFGPIETPSVIIGNNTYTVNTIVEVGARIELNTRDKTITHIDNVGSSTNIFDAGVRGKGEGCGEYCFEPLKPGENKIVWSGASGIDIVWYEKDTVPPWTLS